jgi:hypothetical protein
MKEEKGEKKSGGERSYSGAVKGAETCLSWVPKDASFALNL